GRIEEARQYCRGIIGTSDDGALVRKTRLLERQQLKLRHSLTTAQQALRLMGTHKHDGHRKNIARRQLNGIEGDVSVLIRAAVSSGADDVAGPALDLLIEKEDPYVGEVSALRVIHHPDSALRDRCAGHIAERIDSIDRRLLPPLYRVARADGASAAARRVRQAFSILVGGGLPRETLRDIFRLTRSRETLESGDAVLFMAFVYHAQARRDDEALDGLVQQKGAAAALRRRIAREQSRRSESSGAGTVPDWVAQASELMTARDYVALDDGLLGSWGDGSGAGFRVKRDDLPRSPAPSPQVLALHEGSYSLTMRFKPDALPDRKAREPFHGLIKKESWVFGLVLNADGRARHVHLLEDGKYVSASTKTRVKPGRWHHVGAVLNRSAGTLSLFVDGKLETRISFEPGAAPAKGDDLTARALAALGVRIKNDAGLAFTGLVDGVLVYTRALSAKEIASLANQGTAGSSRPSPKS
ncbi:LamG domain-containing protein, partial [Verrucomicrobiota bacterium]